MKYTFRQIDLLGCACLLGGWLMSSCTSDFKNWNINPNEVTPAQMEQDNLNTGAYFTQMEKGVFIVGKDLGGEYQSTEMLTGDIFAGYIANINTYSYTTYHNAHYALYMGWYNAPFNDAYSNIMLPWKSIRDITSDNSPALAMATVVKVLGMNRVTDMYGPIPYSKFGTAIQVTYDSQEEVYRQFFSELEHAISVLTDYVKTNATFMGNYDYIYSGNVSKWIKLANTLRLRLAMRISNVDAEQAKVQAQAAIRDEGGLMTTVDDGAYLHQTTSLTFVNPIWEVSESFKDVRMGATMDCYLNGYKDPRIASYFRQAAKDNKYHGVRNGMLNVAKDSYVAAASGLNYEQNDGLPWIKSSEAYFLLAEAKLRFGLGTASVRQYYEEGVRTSFAECGASGVDAYLNDSESLPSGTYTDPVNNRNTNVESMLSRIPVAWNEEADESEQLNRIMVQKWIALFPNGQEAWSEMRRTGYPGFVRINSYNYTQEVKQNELISRLKFPTTEYSNNSAHTLEAVRLLGGADIAGTRLWWDVKR